MEMCQWDGCDRVSRKRGYCASHYETLRRSGRLAIREPDAVARFWAKVDKDGPNGCWQWTAGKVHGYGRVAFAGRVRAAHRVSYELLVAPIPDGLQIDHLCRNRACVNPSHLEPVTQQENLRRGHGTPGLNARKTHCVNGHEFTDSNTYWSPAGRHCRLCRKAISAAKAASRKAERSQRIKVATCTVCGVVFEHRGHAAVRLCSDACRYESALRAARLFQRRKRAAG